MRFMPAGLKFGLWVDPGNVDAARVESGEIPAEWLAMIDGKTTRDHASLSRDHEAILSG